MWSSDTLQDVINHVVSESYPEDAEAALLKELEDPKLIQLSCLSTTVCSTSDIFVEYINNNSCL